MDHDFAISSHSPAHSDTDEMRRACGEIADRAHEQLKDSPDGRNTKIKVREDNPDADKQQGAGKRDDQKKKPEQQKKKQAQRRQNPAQARAQQQQRAQEAQRESPQNENREAEQGAQPRGGEAFVEADMSGSPEQQPRVNESEGVQT